MSPWGRPAGVSSRTLPGGLHPLAGNRTGLCAAATWAVRTRAPAPARAGQPCRGKGVEPRPWPSSRSGCAAIHAALPSMSAQPGVTPPPPSQTRSTESVAVGTSCVAAAGHAQRVDGMITPPSRTTRHSASKPGRPLRRASLVAEGERPPGRCGPAPGVFPRPCDGRRALRQGRPKAVVGGRNLTRSGRPHRLARLYHQSRSQAREC